MKDAREPFELLLIEDNPADVALIKEALKRTGLSININEVDDGENALRYLQRDDPFGDKACPDLVLLDLNLPGIDGREVLRRIKSSEQLKHIPVVVLTTSRSAEVVRETYRLQGNCFVTKPLNFREFMQVVTAIQQFWLSVASLPGERSPLPDGSQPQGLPG